MAIVPKAGVLTLIEQLMKAVDDLGVETTTKVLQSAQNKTLSLMDKRVEFVLKMVSNEFAMPIEEMINSYSRSTKRKFSIMFGVYYLHGHFDISFGDLNLLYKRDKALLCRYFHIIRNLSKGEPSERALIKYRDKFDLLVTEFKISNN